MKHQAEYPLELTEEDHAMLDEILDRLEKERGLDLSNNDVGG